MTIKDDDAIQYYIEQIIKYNLSKRELINKIKNKEYQRLSKDLKEKLMIREENKISDFIKNPILIKNSYNYTKITEKILK